MLQFEAISEKSAKNPGFFYSYCIAEYKKECVCGLVFGKLH